MYLLNRLSIKSRFILLGINTLLIAVLISGVGLFGLSESRNDLNQMHEGFVEQGYMVSQILEKLGEARAHMLLALQHDENNPAVNLHKHSVSVHIKVIRKHSSSLKEKWQTIRSGLFNSELMPLAETFEVAFEDFFNSALEPTVQALARIIHKFARRSRRILISQGNF